VSLAPTASPHYVALAGLLAFMAAAWLLSARLVRLGFVADFLSRTVLIGFLTGVGVEVAFGQVGGMLGIPSGPGLTLGEHKVTGSIASLIDTFKGVDQTSWTTLAVSAGVLGFIVTMRVINRKLPGPLIAVIGAIFLSWALDLSSYGVAILGPVPSG